MLKTLKQISKKLKEYQTPREALMETRKVVNNIKIAPANYNLDYRIAYLKDNNIKVKYKGR